MKAIGGASFALYVLTCLAQHRIAFGSLAAWPVVFYLAATAATFFLYVRVLRLAATHKLLGAEKRQAIALPVVFTAALVAVPPSLSIDVYSYIGHAHQARVGTNPYAEPVKTVAQTAEGAELSRRGWLPVHGVSPYGPLWSWVEAALGWTGINTGAQVLVLKGLVCAFSLLCGVIIWAILGRVAPHNQLLGTLMYLWNPVVIVEMAGEGHNDAIVLAGVLGSLLFCVGRRPASSVMAMGAGALVKITALVVAPPLLAYWLRKHDGVVLARLAAGAAAVVAGAAVLYAPFWIGMATFDGIAAHGRPSVLASTPGVLFWYLTRSHSPEASGLLISLASGGALLGAAAFAAAHAVDDRSLLRAAAALAIVYLMIAPGYWPWYAALPIALLALIPSVDAMVVVVVLSAGSRLAAPIERLRISGLTGWNEQVIATTIIGLWVPALVLLCIAIRRFSGSPLAAAWTRIGGPLAHAPDR
jgi:hypothetical protein